MTAPADTAPTAGHRSRSRARWRTLHRWLGLGLGAWFLLVGLSGALLVWREAIDAALNPTWFTARASGPVLPLDVLIERVRSEHGLGRIERIRLPAAPGEVLRLQLRAAPSRVEAGRLEAFIDPASGALLGLRDLHTVSLAPPHLMRTLYEFHRNVLLGEPGSNIVGIAGVLLLTAAVSGLVNAWPRTGGRWRRLLAVSWRANATRVWLDLHRSGGVLVAVVLLLATATGATLVYLTYVRDIVGRLSRVEPIPVLPFRTYAADAPLLTMDQLAQRARVAYPERRIGEIHMTERGLNGVMFKLQHPADVHAAGDTIIWLHPGSGELLAERSARQRSAGESFMHWLLPLHVGSAFGDGGRIAMSAAGLAPLLLLPSGLWVWWKKRGSERLAAGRQQRQRSGPGTPPRIGP